MASGFVEKEETDAVHYDRYNCRMLKTWIIQALQHAGKMTQAELARRMTAALGRSIDRAAVNKMTKGTRDISAQELVVIAEITGYPPPQPKIDPASITMIETSHVRIKVKGFVQAGEWAETSEWPESDWEEIQITQVSEYQNIPLQACRVRGPSMNKIYPDGTILVWVDIHAAMEAPVSGRRYIVRRTRNYGQEYEMTVKTYIENETGAWLVAESDDPEFQGAIKLVDDGVTAVEIIGRVVRSIREE
jgi:SOS-response transcriptional repressor LexA